MEEKKVDSSSSDEAAEVHVADQVNEQEEQDRHGVVEQPMISQGTPTTSAYKNTKIMWCLSQCPWNELNLEVFSCTWAFQML